MAAQDHPKDPSSRWSLQSPLLRVCCRRRQGGLVEPRAPTAPNIVGCKRDPEFVVTAGRDRTAQMWSFKTGRCLRTFRGHEDQIWSCCLSPDARYLFTTCQDGTARMWSVETGECLRVFVHEGRAAPNWACVTPDMRYLCTAVNDCTAKIWDMGTGDLLAEMQHRGCVNSVCISPDGQFLFTASDDNLGRMWQVPTGELVRTFDGLNGRGRGGRGLYSCFLTGDGKWFFTAAFDGQTTMFAVPTGEVVRSFQGAGSASNVCASHAGEYVFVGRDQDGSSIIEMWCTATGELVRSFSGHGHGVTAQWVSRDGAWLCSSSLDGTARVWSTGTGELLRTYTGHRGFVQGIAGA